MSKTQTLDSVLDAAMQLPSAHRNMLVEILSKRQIEKRREAVAAHASEAREALHRGAATTETADELVARLHAAEQENEEE